jgi:hypothetical protein
MAKKIQRLFIAPDNENEITEGGGGTMNDEESSSFVVCSNTPTGNSRSQRGKCNGSSSVRHISLFALCMAITFSVILVELRRGAPQLWHNRNSSSTNPMVRNGGTLTILSDDRNRSSHGSGPSSTGAGADIDTTSPIATTRDANGCAPIAIPVHHGRPGRREWSLLAARKDIPDVNTQTGEGWRIHGLGAFDGQLHLAYGDIVRNTGPLYMHAYSPSEGTWTYKGMLDTEELRVFRHDVARGVLYTPETDAHSEERRTQGVVYQLKCGVAQQWSTAGKPINGSAHVYDLSLFPSRPSDTVATLWAGTGSRTGDSGIVVESRDGGFTWTEVYRLPVYSDAYSRIYYIAYTDELVYLFGRIVRHPAKQKGSDAKAANLPHRLVQSVGLVRYHNETEFRPIDNFEVTAPPSSLADEQGQVHGYVEPIVHGNVLYLVAYAGWKEYYLGTFTFEKGTTTLMPTKPWPRMNSEEDEYDMTVVLDWTIDQAHDTILVLMECCGGNIAVYRAKSIASGNWEELVRLPPLTTEDGNDYYRTLTMLQNDLYLGTDNGNLYIVKEIDQPIY